MRAITYVKMLGAGAACCIGGPALVMWVQPDPDELFKKYNPDLQKKSLAGRDQRLKDHEEFIARLKLYAKDGRPIWVVEQEERKNKIKALSAEKRRKREAEQRQKEKVMEEQHRGL